MAYKGIYLAHTFPPIPPYISITFYVLLGVTALFILLSFSAYISFSYPDLTNKKSIGLRDIWLQGFLTAIISMLAYFAIAFGLDYHSNFANFWSSLESQLAQTLIVFFVVFTFTILVNYLTLRIRIKKAKLKGFKTIIPAIITTLIISFLLNFFIFFVKFNKVSNEVSYEKGIARLTNERLTFESPVFIFAKPKGWDFTVDEENIEKIEKRKIIKTSSIDPTYLSKNGLFVTIIVEKTKTSWEEYKNKIINTKKAKLIKNIFDDYPAAEFKKDENFKDIVTIVQGYKYTISVEFETSSDAEFKKANEKLEQFVATFKFKKPHNQ